MRMIHDYGEFMQLYRQGRIAPDVSSNLGWKSVEYLRRQGWKIGQRRAAVDLLAICSLSEENFLNAYRHAGIDFWVKEEGQADSGNTIGCLFFGPVIFVMWYLARFIAG